MKYNTPELLLVGAAQNLVLGTNDKRPSAGVCLNYDDGDIFYGPTDNLDSACW